MLAFKAGKPVIGQNINQRQPITLAIRFDAGSLPLDAAAVGLTVVRKSYVTDGFRRYRKIARPEPTPLLVSIKFSTPLLHYSVTPTVQVSNSPGLHCSARHA